MADSILDLLVKLTLDDSELSSGLSNVKKGIGGVAGGIAKATVAATAAATTAVVGFAGAAVKSGMDFDSSMSQVAATMGKTVDEMAKETGTAVLNVNGEVKNFSGTLREFAQEMGANTAFSATEAADALNYMALAGYDVQQSMDMLPNVLNLAAAGGFDLARASDMVTDASTAFGLSVDENGPRITQMVDEMAKAASTGNTSVEQLGDAFLVVGGLAQELNGGVVELADGTNKSVDGIQEMEIALTAMANAGVKGSEAGTHMRNMLLKLSSPTSDGTAQMEALGVSVFDTEGNMRSLSSIFGDLNGALSNLTQKEKIQAISDLFNTRDLASAEALLNAVGEDWNKIGESILNAEGSAQQMADTQLGNLTGDITLLKSAFEGFQIAVSDKLTPTLREFVQFGSDGLSKLTIAFQDGGLSGAMDTFGEILAEGLNKIIVDMPKFIQAGMDLLGALGKGLLDNLPVITDAAGQVVVQLVEGIVTALPSIVEGAVQIIGQLATFIGEQLPTLVPVMIEAVLAITNALIDNVDLIVDGAIALATGLAEGLITALPVLIEKVPEIIEKLIEALVTNAPKILVASAEIMIQLALGIMDNLPKIYESALKIVGELLAGFANMWNEIINAGAEITGKVWEGIKSLNPIQWGKDLIDGFVSGIKGAIGKVKDAASNIAEAVKSYLHFSEPDVGPLSNFHTFAPDMVDLFASGIRSNTKKVTNAVDALAGGVATTFDMSVPNYEHVSGNSTTVSRNLTAVGNGGLPTTAGRDLTVILELEKTQLAKAVYRLNNEETQRVGVRLAGGVV